MLPLRLRNSRFGLVILLVQLVIFISVCTRILLFTIAFSQIEGSISTLAGIFLIGIFYDILNACWFVLPLFLYLWLLPSKLFHKKGHLYFIHLLFYLFIYGLLFNGVSEWFFWDEFNSRFNFIAVDYLVYTNEVIGNIRQSYPVEWILLFLCLASAALTYFVSPAIKQSLISRIRFKERSVYFLGYVFLLTSIFFLSKNEWRKFSTNTYANELAGNGLYELFAAYLNNEIDYDQFYKKDNIQVAFQNLRTQIKTPESEFIDNDPYSITRRITNTGPEKKLNVVLISVESLSASFLSDFGNTENITPNLDSLAQKSLLFTNLYATGTRTVRGLEALSISVPPTPGQSIVRRPKNENLFSLGKVFKDKGYQSKFIYGGYGYFDNMGYFFTNNHYEVVDRTKIAKKDIDYENIWGVADENLFTLAIKEIDKTTEAGQPVFTHIMTTSNHRPYTYPEGRIDIPSHTNRAGAVKYTDFALGQFIRTVKSKPWFDNTLFIIVADHCASSAGKTDLPINQYQIPLLIYAPQHIKPGKMNRLMSQIDLAPTILGLLHFSYESKFYGYDIFQLEPGRERAFISTYQNLGYIRQDTMIILKPQNITETVISNSKDGSSHVIASNKALTTQAISWYQTASYQFKHHLLK